VGEGVATKVWVSAQVAAGVGVGPGRGIWADTETNGEGVGRTGGAAATGFGTSKGELKGGIGSIQSQLLSRGRLVLLLLEGAASAAAVAVVVDCVKDGGSGGGREFASALSSSPQRSRSIVGFDALLAIGGRIGRQ
jgi:hypothetical protein